jgi:hypothetical protein
MATVSTAFLDLSASEEPRLSERPGAIRPLLIWVQSEEGGELVGWPHLASYPEIWQIWKCLSSQVTWRQIRRELAVGSLQLLQEVSS